MAFPDEGSCVALLFKRRWSDWFRLPWLRQVPGGGEAIVPLALVAKPSPFAP
jgi:hypothetical protein